MRAFLPLFFSLLLAAKEKNRTIVAGGAPVRTAKEANTDSLLGIEWRIQPRRGGVWRDSRRQILSAKIVRDSPPLFHEWALVFARSVKLHAAAWVDCSGAPVSIPRANKNRFVPTAAEYRPTSPDR